ncbi:anti-sigma factor [Arcicella rigui]|uniref:Regulator of SigK n=1 Tax=Arcicella rigui TaxID=797020 RepID=A0ABU5Q7K6_9BACT|nr:anti-sigma factor [Arcicella rigui]MEA5138809.1 anti-sigma factor [Arcicella rigui]
MNIQEYIESGILESYVLGATTQAESIEVERLAEEYPAIQLELMALQGTLENYALQYAQEPPATLKNSVMEAISKENGSTDTQENIIKPLYKQKSFTNKYSWRFAASWVLLALSIGANIWFFNNWQKSEEKVLALESQNQILAQEGQTLKASYQEEVAILQNPSTKIITLAGQAVAPQAKALVYFNPSKQEVYLSNLSLPDAPVGKQYQLWAIIDGKPVDAGLIDNHTNILKMKSFANAAAFAISLENTGGSTTEAGPKGAVYVVGNV